MIHMRTPVFTVCLILALAAIGVFLVYGGHAASPQTSAEAPEQTGRIEPNAPPAADVRAEIEALTKRVDALTDEVARIRQSSERVPIQTAPVPVSTADTALDPAHHDAIFRVIAEDRDLRDVKEKSSALKDEVMHFAAREVPNPAAFPLQRVLDLLVDARLRYCAIRRRLVPLGQDVDDEGPWKAAFEKEVDALRDWRRSELIKLVGESAAKGCANASAFAFHEF
jgi:hypothetical protein